jgi:hypothetical protein
MKKNRIYILIAVCAVVVVGGFFGIKALLSRNGASAAQFAYVPQANADPARIESFKVEKPNFVIKATSLSKLEIWAVPAGDDVKESDVKKLADATLASADWSNQTWTAPIPRSKMNLSDVYVVGYDEDNKPVTSASLGVTGADAIQAAIWGNGTTTSNDDISGPTASEYKALKLGQSGSYGGMTLTLKTIASDTRCNGSNCASRGTVTGTVTASVGDGAPQTLSFDRTKALHFQGYQITVYDVTPEAPNGSKDYSNYVVTFRIQPS